MAATVTYSKRGDGIINVQTGSFTADGTATTLSLGFNPLYALVLNETDATVWEKIDPMVAANSIKTVTAGTTTVDTGSAIVFNGDGTATLSATLCANAKAIKFMFRR